MLSGVFPFVAYLTGLLGQGIPAYKELLYTHAILMSEGFKMLPCPHTLLKGKAVPKLHDQAMKECGEIEA
jgi:hypothetical protein